MSNFSTSSLPPSQEFGFWDRIRYAILGTGRGKFRSSSNYWWPVNQKVILIDTSPGSLMDVAMQVPHLNTVISTGAELFSLMEIKHVDKDGEEINNSPVLKFLQQPNPLQSLEQYLYEFYILNSVYNKTFQYTIKGLSFERVPSAMWLLPSGWMKINVTGKIYRQSDINEIIEKYVMLNDPTPYEVDNVIYMAEGIGNSPLNPISRIEALQIPLSNIVASLKSRNIITSERGMIGFLSSDASSKDSDGQLPLDKEEAERSRKEFQRQYSLDGQGGHVGFTHANVKWVPMTFDIKQLGLLEGTEDDFATIIAAYRHDRDLYPSVKGATFENKSAGVKATIQFGLQPLADKLMNQWKKKFIDPKTGESLKACYDYLPAMQEDKLKCEQAEETKTRKLSVLYKDGIITQEQYALMAEVDFEEAKNMPQNSSQANLRGLVGSVTGVIQINQFVAQGFIDKPTAQNILMSIYGFDQSTAASMITSLTVDLGTPAPSSSIPKE